MMKKGFDFDKREQFAWKRGRQKAPWPADEDEQNELWRRKVKDQYIRRLLAGTEPKIGRGGDRRAEQVRGSP